LRALRLYVRSAGNFSNMSLTCAGSARVVQGALRARRSECRTAFAACTTSRICCSCRICSWRAAFFCLALPSLLLFFALRFGGCDTRVIRAEPLRSNCAPTIVRLVQCCECVSDPMQFHEVRGSAAFLRPTRFKHARK
jgi:hypothetical protein